MVVVCGWVGRRWRQTATAFSGAFCLHGPIACGRDDADTLCVVFYSSIGDQLYGDQHQHPEIRKVYDDDTLRACG